MTRRRENQSSFQKRASPAVTLPNQFPQCDSHRKFHSRECRKGNRGCFECGQMGHQRKNCPKLAQVRGFPSRLDTFRGFLSRGRDFGANISAQQGRTSASRQEVILGKWRPEVRMFAMTRQEAQATLDVVTGKLSIYDHDAYVLIDPGSTQSYVSSAFFMHITKKLSLLIRL